MDTFEFADLGGIRFEGRLGGESGWEGFVLLRLTGWRGLPGVRGSLHPVPGSHGSYGQESLLRQSRSIGVRALAVSSSAANTGRLLASLEEALATGTVSFKVVGDDGTWSREVEVEAVTPDPRWHNDRVQVTVDLIAPDPVRYRDPVMLGPAGLPVRAGGLVLPEAFPWDFGTSVVPSLEVVNDGAVPVLPVVRVRGAADSVVVHGGPRRVAFDQFDGELVIDSRERRAWLNGSDVTRHLTRRDWHTVAAGDSAAFSFEAVDPSPDTTMTVEYRIGAW